MALLYSSLSMVATGELTVWTKITHNPCNSCNFRSVLEDRKKKAGGRGTRIGEKWEPQMTVARDLAIHLWFFLSLYGKKGLKFLRVSRGEKPNGALLV